MIITFLEYDKLMSKQFQVSSNELKFCSSRAIRNSADSRSAGEEIH